MSELSLKEQRLVLIQNRLRIMKSDVGKLVNSMGIASRNTFYYQLEKTNPDGEFLALLCEKTGIRAEELLNPKIESSVLMPPKSNPRLEADVVRLALNPLEVEGNKSKFFEMPDGSLTMQVPIIPYKAYAGYLHGFQDQEYYEDLDTIMIGVDKRHAGDYLAFEVKGDSMVTYDPQLNEKSIHPGRLAIGRFLPQHHWRSKLHIGNNDAWVIVHKTEGILIKNIIKHDVDKGIITIHSLNPDKNAYPDEDLKLEEIEQIFDVLQVVDKRR